MLLVFLRASSRTLLLSMVRLLRRSTRMVSFPASLGRLRLLGYTAGAMIKLGLWLFGYLRSGIYVQLHYSLKCALHISLLPFRLFSTASCYVENACLALLWARSKNGDFSHVESNCLTFSAYAFQSRVESSRKIHECCGS